MLAYGTGCHMSSFVVIEQELVEKIEVADYPTIVSIHIRDKGGRISASVN
jgi:hypothetical protein